MTSVPQYAGSDTTMFYGVMYADLQETTIQLMPGAYISAAVGAPGEGGVPGLYAPFDPVISNPNTTTPDFNPDSNYGLAIPAIGKELVQYGLRIDFGAPGYPSTPMTLTGISFNLAGQAMSFSAGREAFVSALGADTHNVTGDPFLYFGSAGSNIGSWDGVSITLPVHSSFSRVLTTEFGGISEFVDVSGQFVLTPWPMPEPSTFVISGFGVVALVGYRRRARKRRSRSE